MPILQNRAVRNLFVSPNRIEDVADSMRRIERGDIKLRVRALETERALTRVTVSPCFLHSVTDDQLSVSIAAVPIEMTSL